MATVNAPDTNSLTPTAPASLKALLITPEELTPPPGAEAERVNVHIQSIISRFLEALQIPESSVVRPTVFLSNSRDTSCYLPLDNQIHIVPDHQGKLDVYGEEVVHWLRTQMQPATRVGIFSLTADRQVAVDEFFGYLGFCLAQQVCAGHEVAALERSYPVDSSPDVLRKYRIQMETIEKDLTILRAFTASEKGTELRTLAKNLTILVNTLKTSQAPFIETLRLWVDIFGERLAKVAAAPPVLFSQDGLTWESEARLSQLLKNFSARITTIAGRTDDESTMSQAAESSRDDEVKQRCEKAAHLLADYISDVLEKFRHAEKQLEDSYQSLLDHCDGYEAATVFLQRSENPIEELKELLTTPCRTVFFKHVFGAHLDAKHRPSSLSQWKEAFRMGMRRIL
jgi:hypothetical protein